MELNVAATLPATWADLPTPLKTSLPPRFATPSIARAVATNSDPSRREVATSASFSILMQRRARVSANFEARAI